MGVDAAIDITTEEGQTVLALLQRHLPGTAAWVYGSRVKWTSRPQSDLDLVVFATPEQRPQVGYLREAFEESNLPFRVDLFVWDEVPDSFRARIEAEHVALAATGERQDDERWKEVPLGNLVDIYDGPHATPKKTPRGPVFLGISNLASGRLDITQTQHLSEPDYLSWTRRVTPKPNDIVFSYETRLGEAALIPEGLRACLGRRMGLLRVRDGAIEARFLLYAFLGERFQTTLRSRTVHGSTVDRIPLTEMADFPIYVPQALTEQLAIAHVLGTLDDKIELNRRMNATLEALARALFRSWFVDFDPVRAKMEGRDTGLPKDIADLFPDRLVESELGEVPDGWALERLSEHFKAVKGVSYKGSGLEQDGVPLHNLNSIHEGGGYKYEGIKYYTGEYKDRHVVRPGDVIVANTEQGHDRLLIGYAAIVPGLFGDHGIYSHHVYRLRPRSSGHLSAPFLHLLLNSPWMHDVVSGYANGTTVNMLPMDAVQKPMVVVPPMALLEAFDALALHSRHRREQAVRDSRTLGVLRDALLPKLVCGELRVNTSEAAFGRWSADIGGNARDGRNAPA